MRRAAALVLAVAALAALPGVALAACPQTSVADVEDEVMCPVCGTPLALAKEAPQAERQRAFIQQRVDRCESKDQIKAALAAEYGEDVLAIPDDEGFELTAYLVPALALLLGAGAVALALLRWGRGRRGEADGAAPAPGEPKTAPPADRAAAARLQADLERYDL